MSHLMMFRLGAVDNEEQGVVSAATAERALNDWLAKGYRIQSVVGGGTNQFGTELVIVLVKSA